MFIVPLAVLTLSRPSSIVIWSTSLILLAKQDLGKECNKERFLTSIKPEINRHVFFNVDLASWNYKCWQFAITVMNICTSWFIIYKTCKFNDYWASDCYRKCAWRLYRWRLRMVLIVSTMHCNVRGSINRKLAALQNFKGFLGMKAFPRDSLVLPLS